MNTCDSRSGPGARTCALAVDDLGALGDARGPDAAFRRARLSRPATQPDFCSLVADGDLQRESSKTQRLACEIHRYLPFAVRRGSGRRDERH